MTNIELRNAEIMESHFGVEPVDLPEYYFTVERLTNQLFRLQMLQEQGHDVSGMIGITWEAISIELENGREIKSIN